MSKQTERPLPSPSPNEQADTLAKLQRLYGRRSLRPHAFGRRPAMPSEIARLVDERQPSEPQKPGRS